VGGEYCRRKKRKKKSESRHLLNIEKGRDRKRDSTILLLSAQERSHCDLHIGRKGGFKFWRKKEIESRRIQTFEVNRS